MSHAARERTRAPLRVLILWNGDEASDDGRAVDEHAAAAHGMAALLGDHGFRASVMDAEDDLVRIADAVTVLRPSIVINLVDAFYGDSAQRVAVAGYLDLLDVPYVGADPACLAACRDRVHTRVLLDQAGVAVPRFAVIRDTDAAADQAASVGYPVVVTHAHDPDAGAVVASPDEMVACVAARGLPCLVEEHRAHRCVHAMVVGTQALDVLPLVESAGAAIAPAALAVDTAEHVRELARRAFRIMGCRDVACIDIEVDERGVSRVVAVRPMFDMGPGSALWAAAEHTELGPGGVLAAILREACARAAIEEHTGSTSPASDDLALLDHEPGVRASDEADASEELEDSEDAEGEDEEGEDEEYEEGEESEDEEGEDEEYEEGEDEEDEEDGWDEDEAELTADVTPGAAADELASEGAGESSAAPPERTLR